MNSFIFVRSAVGRALHEDPGFIQSYDDPKDPRVLRENQVITIEPFLSTGAREIFDAGDGWTLVTSPRFLTARYEHTLAIAKGMPLIMTLPASSGLSPFRRLEIGKNGLRVTAFKNLPISTRH